MNKEKVVVNCRNSYKSSCSNFKMKTKNHEQEIRRLKLSLSRAREENRNLKKTIMVISNEKIVKGLTSAIKDFQEGKFTILAK